MAAWNGPNKTVKISHDVVSLYLHAMMSAISPNGQKQKQKPHSEQMMWHAKVGRGCCCSMTTGAGCAITSC